MEDRALNPSRRSSAAILVTLAMGVLYTWLDIARPAAPRLLILAFLPGAVSVVALRASGLQRGDLYLRRAPLSRDGALLLLAVTVLLLPILGSSSAFAGWRWLPGLVYAPASGIAQELYFRSALLPSLERVFARRARPALIVHATAFVLFHWRTFQLIPTVPIALLAGSVLFIGGLGWGAHVQRGRTVLWAMLHHGAMLALMSMFAWG